MAGRYETARRVDLPDRLVMQVADLLPGDAEPIAMQALAYAFKNAPKATGNSARNLKAVYGDGFFGIQWQDAQVWYQESGIRPFTMKSLEGRTIPMWADDPKGDLRRDNPKAKTRVLPGGRKQTLIFRKVARRGDRRKVRRMQAGRMVVVDVPASFPGAPGRIALRHAGSPDTTPGYRAGQIHAGNVGVRWRHPGLSPRGFIEHALRMAAREGGVPEGPIYPVTVSL